MEDSRELVLLRLVGRIASSLPPLGKSRIVVTHQAQCCEWKNLCAEAVFVSRFHSITLLQQGL